MNESTEASPDTPSAIPGAVIIYACPECGSWYGSSSAPDLENTFNIRSALKNLATEDPSEWGKPTGPRTECQHCRAAGKTIYRVKITYLNSDAIRRELDRGIETAYVEEEKRSGLKLIRQP